MLKKCDICGELFDAKGSGKRCSKECRREGRLKHMREYNQRPEVKARDWEYYQRPEVKENKRESMKKYYQRPEVKENKREYKREYNQRPEVKARRRERMRKRGYGLRLLRSAASVDALRIAITGAANDN